jgi:hypothetical protein
VIVVSDVEGSGEDRHAGEEVWWWSDGKVEDGCSVGASKSGQVWAVNGVQDHCIRANAPINQESTRGVRSGWWEGEKGVVTIEIADEEERETRMGELGLRDKTQ